MGGDPRSSRCTVVAESGDYAALPLFHPDLQRAEPARCRRSIRPLSPHAQACCAAHPAPVTLARPRDSRLAACRQAGACVAAPRRGGARRATGCAGSGAGTPADAIARPTRIRQDHAAGAVACAPEYARAGPGGMAVAGRRRCRRCAFSRPSCAGAAELRRRPRAVRHRAAQPRSRPARRDGIADPRAARGAPPHQRDSRRLRPTRQQPCR
ncbi:tetratricopeptide repeat protein [Xanthomonas citri pv. mangiferaeindicae]|nr:tetratricopeptide repeat protein [Xanthomonas citri pv. mangiferaeindicae]